MTRPEATLVVNSPESVATPSGHDPDSLAGAVDLLAQIGCLLLQHGADAQRTESCLKRLVTLAGVVTLGFSMLFNIPRYALP